MSNYRRAKFEGGYYFFTVITYKRRPFLVSELARHHLRRAFEKMRTKRYFETIAFCLLPEHLHCIWKLPENDADSSTRWRKIKNNFSQTVDGSILPLVGSTKLGKSKREVPIWQRRFWEHTIRDEKDYEAHMDYVHINPVKHGYVDKARDWPFSTFHRCVELGLYPEDWGSCTEFELDVGEDHHLYSLPS